MENIDKVMWCTGCFLCMSECPQNCISIGKDSLDTKIPVINATECISCGKCLKVCPQHTAVERNYPINTYVGMGVVNGAKISSASGGVASALYKWAVNNKYCCVGAMWNKDKKSVELAIATDESELEKFRNSKYIFSETNSIFKRISEIIKTLNKKILVIAMPCQIAALKSALKKEYENGKIIFIDIVCHGMSNDSYFEQHLNHIMLQGGADNIAFREKGNFVFSVYNNDSCVYKANYDEDSYFLSYLEGVTYRENCYHCQYAASERIGDLTIGDFDGIDSESIKNDKLRTLKYPSMILVNTKIGEKLLQEVDSIVKEKRLVAEAFRYNEQLKKPAQKSLFRSEFVRRYEQSHDLEKAIRPYWKKKVIKKHIYNLKIYKLAHIVKVKIKNGRQI